MSSDAFNRTAIANTNISLNYSLPGMIAVGTLLLVMVVSTVAGNFLVGLALFKYRNLRTISNYLIGNLALSDLLLATTVLPLSSINECLGYWAFGPWMCAFWLSVDVFYCTASIWNLCVIAFDRFTATLYPIWYHEKRTTKQAAVYIAFVWFISLAICAPPLIGWNDLSHTYIEDPRTKTYRCVLYQSPSYVLYSASGSFFIPFLLTVLLYVRIFSVLHTRMRRLRSSRAAGQSSATPSTGTTSATANSMKRATTNVKSVLGNLLTSRLSGSKCSRGLYTTEGVSTGMAADAGVGESRVACVVAVAGRPHRDDDDDDEEEEDVSSPHSSHSSPRSSQRGFTSDMYSLHAVSSTTDGGGAAVGGGVAEGRVNGGRASGGVAKDCRHSLCHGDRGTSEFDCKCRRERCGCNHDPRSCSAQVLLDVKSARGGGGGGGSARARSKTSGEKQRHLANVKRQRRLDQREVRATIRMSIIIACFCGCWLGFFTLYTLNGLLSGLRIPHALEAFFFWLGYSNSVMNPVLYAIFNDDFRVAFQKILGCYKHNGAQSSQRHRRR